MEDKRENGSEVRVEIIDGGPVKISGDFILKDIKRNKESTPGEVWICRCGKSSSKPYCDDSHKRV